jgi:hypothetical protein
MAKSDQKVSMTIFIICFIGNIGTVLGQYEMKKAQNQTISGFLFWCGETGILRVSQNHSNPAQKRNILKGSDQIVTRRFLIRLKSQFPYFLYMMELSCIEK